MKIISFFVFGLVVCVCVSFVTSNIMYPWKYSSIDIEVGKEIFSQKCANCHAVSSAKVGGLGPNLSNIGLHAVSRDPSQSSYQYILRSILYPEEHETPGSEGAMPAGLADDLSDNHLRNLVTYVASLGADVNYIEIAKMSIPKPSVQNNDEAYKAHWKTLIQGRELFQSKGCSACHGIHELPGEDFRAPSLAQSGRHSKQYLEESIRSPSKVITPTYRQVNVRTVTGVEYTGRLISREDDHLVVFINGSFSKEPHRVRIESEDIESLRLDVLSPMPVYTLMPQEEAAIVDFLMFLEAKL